MNIFIQKISILLFCILSLTTISWAQNKHSFSVMFYNVENLFDTIDDPHKNDNEFLPTGQKKWDTRKYYKKLHNISKVIIASGKWNAPDIVGFAEIENSKCTQDIVSKTALSKIRYKTIHYESRDRRGIDVACIYNPKTVSIIKDTVYPIIFAENKQITTRDILHVEARMTKYKDTVHLFICHFPSRFGGTKKSEFKRIYAASILKTKIDSVKKINPNSHIIIVGDFNDDPTNQSIKTITSDTLNYKNLSLSDDAKSHYYRGVWRALDQCIISTEITQKYNITYSSIKLPFILETDKNNTQKPFRTYQGPAYLGGYSDHLPIKIELQIK